MLNALRHQRSSHLRRLTVNCPEAGPCSEPNGIRASTRSQSQAGPLRSEHSRHSQWTRRGLCGHQPAKSGQVALFENVKD